MTDHATDVAPARLRVLAVEPFYGGSHRAFLDGWVQRSRHRFDLVTFTDRHWKWRMRHGALSASRRVEEWVSDGRSWDVVWASDMLDLASFRGLCPAVASLPAVLYFHENQVTYPWRSDGAGDGQGRDVHYAYTNFLSALAADEVWFNSAFHRDDWLGALPSFLARFPDHRNRNQIDRIDGASQVQSPGVSIDSVRRPAKGQRVPAFDVVWAARWEHDKAPEALFEALRIWRARSPEHWGSPGLPIRLHVLGESYGEIPDCFRAAQGDLEGHLETWGFADRRVYLGCLHKADVFVSTARHEFFGISAVEAMAAGAHPLLPRRLSYPELVQDCGDCLYDAESNDSEQLAERLAERYEAQIAGEASPRERWRLLADRYGWSQRVPTLDSALEKVAQENPAPGRFEGAASRRPRVPAD